LEASSVNKTPPPFIVNLKIKIKKIMFLKLKLKKIQEVFKALKFMGNIEIYGSIKI
jgi:hypothetical protein